MSSKNLASQPDKRPKWMIVHITHDINVAHIISGRLKHEGIENVLDHMAGRSAIGITIGSMGEIRILVHEKDYDLALDILDPEEPEVLSEDNDQTIFGLDDDDTEDDHDYE